MNRSLRPLLLVGAGLCAWSTFGRASAQVVEPLTPSGTVISNQAFADYSDANGNPLQRASSNVVTTTVSQVASVDITPTTSASVSGNLETVVYSLDVFNTGNGPDTFNLVVNGVDPGWTVALYADLNNNGVLDANELAAGPITSTTQVPAGGRFDLIAVVSTPNATTAPNGSSDTFTVTATSQLNNAVSDTSTITTTISTAVIDLKKTTAPNNPTPGSTVTYTLNYSNTGSQPGTAAVITDPLPAGVTLVQGSLPANATYDAATRQVTVDLGTINNGTSGSVSFQVTVNAGLTAGTTVTNTATLSYQSGGQTLTDTSNPSSFTITQVAGVDLSPDAATAANANPGDVVSYPFTLTNLGNSADTFNINTNTNLGFPVVIWVDNNNDGIAGNDGDFVLTDTNGDGIVDTGLVPQGGTVNLVAQVTVPPGRSDQVTNTLVVTATSTTQPGITDSVTFTTTVTAPLLVLAKAVSPTGDQPPGTVLTYTVVVTNTGTGVATNVTITDPIPANTTYVPGSVTLDGVARTDAQDADPVLVNGGVVAVTVPSIGAGGSRTITLQVRIK